MTRSTAASHALTRDLASTCLLLSGKRRRGCLWLHACIAQRHHYGRFVAWEGHLRGPPFAACSRLPTCRNGTGRAKRSVRWLSPPEAEIAPSALDQVNACVGNVLPLPSLSPFLPFPASSWHATDCLSHIDGHPALGSGILFTYPQVSTIAGLQGLIVYAFASSLPLLVFGFVGPVIRRKCPEGFVLTEWTRQRYGIVTALYLGVLT